MDIRYLTSTRNESDRERVVFRLMSGLAYKIYSSRGIRTYATIPHGYNNDEGSFSREDSFRG
jgi:hypothetical protein